MIIVRLCILKVEEEEEDNVQVGGGRRVIDDCKIMYLESKREGGEKEDK